MPHLFHLPKKLGTSIAERGAGRRGVAESAPASSPAAAAAPQTQNTIQLLHPLGTSYTSVRPGGYDDPFQCHRTGLVTHFDFSAPCPPPTVSAEHGMIRFSCQSGISRTQSSNTYSSRSCSFAPTAEAPPRLTAKNPFQGNGLIWCPGRWQEIGRQTQSGKRCLLTARQKRAKIAASPRLKPK